MKYQSSPDFTHNQDDKVGVLVTNLGTPDAPKKAELKRYLKEFLSDPRVVEVPRLLWWMILNLVILNIRPKRSAKAYATVWTERGSPLMFHTQDQTKALRDNFQQQYGSRFRDALWLSFSGFCGRQHVAAGGTQISGIAAISSILCFNYGFYF